MKQSIVHYINESLATMGARSQYVLIDGINTHYIEAGSGPTLILIHGGGAGADAWGNWKTCLAEYAKNFHVIAYDMPGFGLSDKPDPSEYDYSQERRNKNLIEFIEHLRAGPVHVIGNSMGGATSLGVAIQRPDLIEKLVLMGSAGLAISNPDTASKKALSNYDYTDESMRNLMRSLGGPNYQIDESLLQHRQGLMSDPAARKAIEAIRRTKFTYDRDVIASVKTRTLVVGGKEDKVAILARTYGYLEPPRFLRRLFSLRGLSHEEVEQVLA